MRVKEVPKEILDEGGKLLNNKWVLYGGIALVALVGGYFLLQGQANAGQSVSIGTPTQYGVPGTNTANVPTSAIAGGSSGGIDPTTQALLDASNQQTAANQQLQAAQLASNTQIAEQALSTQLQEAQLSEFSTVYSASTNVLDTFISKSPGSLSVFGTVQPTDTGGVAAALFNVAKPGYWGTLPGTYGLAALNQTGLFKPPNAVQPTSTQPASTTSGGSRSSTSGQTSPTNANVNVAGLASG